jgi:GT2 family glycosyltransferase
VTRVSAPAGGLPPFLSVPNPLGPVKLARQALERGQGSSDPAEAVRWLDRACRLLPSDPTLTLALAAACLGQDDARAAWLLAGLGRRHDVGEVWLLLAAAHLAMGDAEGAAQALARALTRHVATPALTSLAETVARSVAAAGWCGIGPDGLLLVGPAGVSPEWTCDGVALRSDRERPVRAPDQAARLEARVSGRPLLGSPIDLLAIRRVEGFVAAAEGGLRGWAWRPAAPEEDPVLVIRPARGQSLHFTASDADAPTTPGTLLARPRAFEVSSAALAHMTPPYRVLGTDRRDLFGSPIDPDWEQRAAAGAAAASARLFPAGPMRPRRSCLTEPPAIPADIPRPARPEGAGRRRPATAEVVIPVHGRPEITLACLESVLASVQAPDRVLVIDDASPEPELVRALEKLAAAGRIRLIRHPESQGFPAVVNVGLRAADKRDVVLLNSDTFAPPGWLERLREAAYAAPDIGTATPFSNNATILSYPGPAGANPMPDRAATRRLAALAHRTNADTVIDIPVAVGFCMYVRRDCLEATGRFRTDVFAQGYGEENDFCLRASRLGWRHVAATGAFVAHLGGESFGGPGRVLQDRNDQILRRLHPGYERLIGRFARDNPLHDARRRMDIWRWRAARASSRGAAVLITHEQGGGVERRIEAVCSLHAAAGRRAIVLRPARLPGDNPAVQVCDGSAEDFPNLRFALPDELSALVRLLRAERPAVVELHHLLGHDPSILDLPARLGAPYEVHVHDYAWLCARVMLIGPARRYCGEPGVAGCETCVADAGSMLDEEITPAALRHRSAGLLAGARRVVAPSRDAADRIALTFPGIDVEVVPHESDPARLNVRPGPVRGRRCRICVVGAIGIPKGYEVLLACARDAARRDLPLEFIVVGHTIDDERLLLTERVFVTGRYEPDEVIELIGAQAADLAFLPSIWPETWCLSLGEAWRAGLAVAAFDIGAIAERIRRAGGGLVLPLGLSAPEINEALLAACGLSVHECGSRDRQQIRSFRVVEEQDG